MFRTGVACHRVVAIDPDACVGGGLGKRSRMFAHASVCARERTERERDHDDAGGRESREPSLIPPVLQSDSCSGDDHDCSIKCHAGGFKP